MPRHDVASQAWGGDIHVGRYDLLGEDELKLGVRAWIKRATKLSTGILLGKAFPADRPSPAGSTIAEMGSAFGTTSRTAAREYGCNVSGIYIDRSMSHPLSLLCICWADSSHSRVHVRVLDVNLVRRERSLNFHVQRYCPCCAPNNPQLNKLQATLFGIFDFPTMTRCCCGMGIATG